MLQHITICNIYLNILCVVDNFFFFKKKSMCGWQLTMLRYTILWVSLFLNILKSFFCGCQLVSVVNFTHIGAHLFLDIPIIIVLLLLCIYVLHFFLFRYGFTNIGFSR
jgi:hypothetical protein